MNTHYKTLTALLSLIILASCQSPQRLSLAEKNQVRIERLRASQALLKGVSPKEVFRASEEVFNMKDKDDFTMELRDNTLHASRYFTGYYVLSALFGRDFYEVEAQPQGQDTLVNVRFSQVSDNGTFPAPISLNNKPNMEIGGDWGFTLGDYDLFYNRLRYFLGETEQWSTCKEYNAGKDFEQSAHFMCKSVGIEDKSPI